MPWAGFHYNLGTSRGPDKIGSRARPGPARGPRLARGWIRSIIMRGSGAQGTLFTLNAFEHTKVSY